MIPPMQQQIRAQSSAYSSSGTSPTLNNDTVRDILCRQSDFSMKHLDNKQRQAAYYKGRADERASLLKQIDAVASELVTKQLDTQLVDLLRQQVAQDKRSS